MKSQPLLQVVGDGKGGLVYGIGQPDDTHDLPGLLGRLVVAMASGQ